MKLYSYTPVVIFNRKSKIPDVPRMVMKEFKKHYTHLLNSLINTIKYLARMPQTSTVRNATFLGLICLKRKTTYPYGKTESGFGQLSLPEGFSPAFPIGTSQQQSGVKLRDVLKCFTAPHTVTRNIPFDQSQYYSFTVSIVILISIVHVQGASRSIVGILLLRSENQEKSLYYAATSCLFFSRTFPFSIHFTKTLQLHLSSQL